MKFRRVLALLLVLIISSSMLPIVARAEEDGDRDDGGGGGDITIIDSYNTYYNYYYINDDKHDYLDLYSLNNTDSNAYWRPKYEEVSVPIQEFVEFNDKDVKINVNGFDVNWSTVNKSAVPSSRELEILGYDFLLFDEDLNLETGNVNRTLGYKSPITAPYFIMNVYKALGIELYDIYFRPETDGESNCGVFITRTNPESYWKLFINDHPIDLSVYNDMDVNNITSGKVISTAEAISILAQMLDFYGEPVISKQEEYMLLQVYGDDVPSELADTYKEAWSYLKCRGVIGEHEYDYNADISFEDMMELLMRAGDKNSRTNFKEIQITTDIDSSFIENGFYDTEVKIANQPSVSPTSEEVDFSAADRIDFLIEINDDIAFRFLNTNELNRNIFISKGQSYNSSPIPGSVFKGIVHGSFYHFSVPYAGIKDGGVLYLNSNKGGDYPLNYKLPNSKGGVYSTYEYNSSTGYVTYTNSLSFDEVFPDSFYVDIKRKSSGSKSRVSAASGNLKLSFKSDLIDIGKSSEAIKSIGGTLTDNKNGSFTVIISLDKLEKLGIDSTSYTKYISRSLVVKEDYRYVSSAATKAILGLTGERLLVNLNEVKKSGLINGYKALPEDNTLIVYTCDGDIVIVDNKNKTIQKGNMYLQIQEDQPLYTIDKGSYCVDFRALFGTKEIGFKIDTSSGEPIVNFYSNKNSYVAASSNVVGPIVGDVFKMNDYVWYSTKQRNACNGITNCMSAMDVDLLYKFGANGRTIDRILLPMSSSNPMGNYILYGKMNSNIGREEYHIVRITPTKVAPVHSGSDKNKTIDNMFWYKPQSIPLDKYSVSVVKLSADNNIGFEYIDGVGWCYNLRRTDYSNRNNVRAFMRDYRNSSNGSFLPFAYSVTDETQLLNYNINYMNENEFSNVEAPNSSTYNNHVLAPIAIQTWFTNPELVPTLSLDTIQSYSTNSSRAPYLYWGSMECEISSSGSIVTEYGTLNVTNKLPENIRIAGMNRAVKGYKGESTYISPGVYSITTEDFNTTINQAKEDERNSIEKKLIDAQEFFSQFKDITFMDFIHGLDNSMSIAYYITTRVIPLIILCLLVLMLLISMVSDIRIVQLFCDRVFDPVKILTFGNYNIHTMNNRFLIISLIGALTIMGIIQSGNLEKIIMWSIEWFYAIMGLFG